MIKIFKAICLFIVALFFLQGCANKVSDISIDSSDESNKIQIEGDRQQIDAVRNGVLEQIDGSLTVKNALENYVSYSAARWTTEQDSQGRKYVVFFGFIENDPDKCKEKYPDIDVENLELCENTITKVNKFMFLLNADMTSFTYQGGIAYCACIDESQTDDSEQDILKVYKNEESYSFCTKGIFLLDSHVCTLNESN
ncbi:MAG TPA: hypothetical protein PKH33_04265 [bacterium]|nr:hypothetical protein [bacterium]